MLLISSSGGIGRRVGLKIQSGAISVPVQVWPGAITKDPHKWVFFSMFLILYDGHPFLPVQLRRKRLRMQAHKAHTSPVRFAKSGLKQLLKDPHQWVFFSFFIIYYI